MGSKKKKERKEKKILAPSRIGEKKPPKNKGFGWYAKTATKIQREENHNELEIKLVSIWHIIKKNNTYIGYNKINGS